MKNEFWLKLVGVFTILGGVSAFLVVPEVRSILGLEASSSNQTIRQNLAQPLMPQPRSVSPGTTSGQFQVEASTSEGTTFLNSYGKSVAIKFYASGQWSFWPEQGFHTANGNPSYPVASQSGPNYRLPTVPLGSLLLKRSNGGYEFIGSERVSRLAAGEQVSFIMNDSVNYGRDYNDNEGILTVNWWCLDCQQ